MNTCSIDDYSQEQINQIININLKAPVELIKLVSKNMIENKWGRIINVASIVGQIGHPDIWYGITKAGLINATKSFSKNLGKHGILVNVIAPGIVSTNMLNTIPKERQKAFLENVNSKRFAQPQEIAKTAVWLATQSPVYINGSCIDINVGAHAR